MIFLSLEAFFTQEGGQMIRAMVSKQIIEYLHLAVPLYDPYQLLAKFLSMALYVDTAILAVLNTCLSCLCLIRMTVSLRYQSGPRDS